MDIPDHLLTLEEWDELPEEGYRWAELAEVVLLDRPADGAGMVALPTRSAWFPGM